MRRRDQVIAPQEILDVVPPGGAKEKADKEDGHNGDINSGDSDERYRLLFLAQPFCKISSQRQAKGRGAMCVQT